MRTRTVLMVSALLACGAASAQRQLSTVEVSAESRESVIVSCANPVVSPQDAERVLALNDPAKTAGLRKKLVSAVAEACKEGVPRILVSRSANGGSLTWKQAD